MALILPLDDYRDIARQYSGTPAAAAILGLLGEVEALDKGLREIANGDGVYGAQAWEYKRIARRTLGLPEISQSAPGGPDAPDA